MAFSPSPAWEEGRQKQEGPVMPPHSLRPELLVLIGGTLTLVVPAPGACMLRAKGREPVEGLPAAMHRGPGTALLSFFTKSPDDFESLAFWKTQVILIPGKQR